MSFSVIDTGMLGKRNWSRTCDILIASSDALPLSYRRLVEASIIISDVDNNQKPGKMPGCQVIFSAEKQCMVF